MLALACAVYVGYRTDAITFIVTMPCIEVARIADNDQPTLIDDADWQPLSPREPPGSGSSAVQKENGTRLSCGLSGQVAHLVKPKRDLRLFDATTPETKAACEANCFHAWCELSPRGLAEAFSDSARLDGPDSPAGTGSPFVPNQTAGHARWVARQGPDTRARLSLDARAVGTLNDRLRQLRHLGCAPGWMMALVSGHCRQEVRGQALAAWKGCRQSCQPARGQ